MHQVGAGVLGPVFLARDAERGKSVAIKVFRLDITPEQAAELSSHLAALARANLAHPSIIVPFEAGVEGTVPFLAEDYVTAESLDAAIRQYGPPPLSQAIRILAALAGALDFAGAVGVLHGALHPRDLLVTADETRVSGLGIAKALETIGLRAPMRRPYVAPERVEREGWDARADIYSLGVLARELLLGRSRSDGERPRLPDDQAERLQAVVSKATAARMVDRYPSALELMSAIQEALIARGAAVPAGDEAAATRFAVAKQPVTDLLPLGEPEPVVEPPPDLELRDTDTADHAAPLDATGVDRDIRPGAQAVAEADIAAAPIAITPAAVARETAPEASAEPGPPAPRTGHHASVPAALERATLAAPPPRRRRSRSLVWPVAAVLLVVLGVAAGYFLGTTRGAPSTSASSAVAAPPHAVPGSPSASTPRANKPVQPPGAGAQAPAPVPAVPPPDPQSPGQQSQPPAAGGGAPVLRSPSNTTARAAAKASLVIRSTPRGAIVSLNGRRRGVTPLALRNLEPGRYRVSVSRRGYDTEERDVVLSAERPSSTLTFSLDRIGRAQAVTQPPAAAPRPTSPSRNAVARTDSGSRTDFFGLLSVDSLPTGARVFVDGKLLGTTPLAPTRLPAGSHAVRVDMIGFLPWTTPIQITTGQRKSLTASLERESR